MADDGRIPDPLNPYRTPPPQPPASSGGPRPSWEAISIVTAIVLVTVVVVVGLVGGFVLLMGFW
ncbi:hypothetical protein [Kineosporia sp. NBRC 101731]|uniref:hypothetical protein n=1 Tax=Kineosporia sp. NBRC 101731 TaxID=3032199 RepID=UPI00255656C5|nr:hypothetical protein [Kineosporia sp. NBRC 101731]